MIVTQEMREYLSGEQFSNGYECRLERNRPMERIERLVELTRGKTVLHIGCADHLPLIDSKIAEGRYLHQCLVDNCAKVVGIDLNTEAIDHMKSLGFTDVYTMDVVENNGLLRDVVSKSFPHKMTQGGGGMCRIRRNRRAFG